MPGLEGDLEEWQTQEVNVTRGEAEGDIPQGHPRAQALFVLLFPTVLLFGHILIFSRSCEMTDSDTLGLHFNFYDELQK